MKTFELILCPPSSRIKCKYKTAKANSIKEFAELCDEDPNVAELLNCGWTISAVREVK